MIPKSYNYRPPENKAPDQRGEGRGRNTLRIQGNPLREVKRETAERIPAVWEL